MLGGTEGVELKGAVAVAVGREGAVAERHVAVDLEELGLVQALDDEPEAHDDGLVRKTHTRLPT